MYKRQVEQIEELAGDILMYGLKQNLELVYAPVSYTHLDVYKRQAPQFSKR